MLELHLRAAKHDSAAGDKDLGRAGQELTLRDPYLGCELETTIRPGATQEDTMTLARRDDPNALHPWLALRSLITVIRDTENTAAGTLMVRSLSGRSSERLYARIAADPMGARILSEGRRLEDRLNDRDALAALPLGSLGQSYAAWTRAEGISAQGLLDATDLGTRADLDQRALLLETRGTVSHDLWHVVTGYGRDLLGEAALLHIILLQTGNTGLIVPCWLGLLASEFGREGRRLILDARRRARRAAWLPAADWETLLGEPLPAVRERLGLGPPPRYTPVWRDPVARAAGVRLRAA